MELFLSLHSDIYELTLPYNYRGEIIQFLKKPITVGTYCKFLNEINHVEKGDECDLLNTINYDSPCSYLRNEWLPKEKHEDYPMTLITFKGCKLFARNNNLQLYTIELWENLLKYEQEYIDQLNIDSLNIEEKYGGVTQTNVKIESKSGIFELMGNICFWGEKIDEHFAYCFGTGWNKSRINIKENNIKKRWSKISSVSTGLRCYRVLKKKEITQAKIHTL